MIIKVSNFVSSLVVTTFLISPTYAQVKPTDDNLFPIVVTNPTDPGIPTLPGDPGTPNIPGLPNIPGVPNIPSIPGSIPIGGGGSFNPIFGGVGSGNTQIQVAQVPNEFYCPLFESNPYDSIFRALDSLTSSMKVNPECQQQQPQYSDFYSDSEKIRNLVTQLQQLQADPNMMNSTSTRDIERIITDAVSGVSNIANNLSNNKLLNKNCGPSKSSVGKALLAVNDILNNLAPVGLVIAAANPAIGIATKVALMGGVYATTAIKGFDQVLTANSLDLNNSEVRKAILQNTCQFVKVRQKIDFLQLGEEGRLSDIKDNLFKNIEAYRARYNNPSTNLLPLMQYKYQTEKIVTDVEAKIIEDKYNVNFYNAKIKAAGDDKERICLIGSSLAKTSKDAETFPASSLRILELAVEVSKMATTDNTTGASGIVDPKVQTGFDELYAAFNKSRNRLSLLAAIALGEDIEKADKAIPTCAEETKIWAKRIYDIVVFSENIVNKEIQDVEKQLSQSDEYKVWNAQYVKLKAEKGSMDRVLKVLREMARPDAVYIRSELDQRSQELKASLFRSNRIFGLSTSRSPVYAWLQNNLEMHQRSVSRLTDFIKLLKKGSTQIVQTAKADTTSPLKSLADHDKQVMQDLYTNPSKLENINLRNLPKGSRQHEIACQQLQEAYLKYKAARDYLGSAEFMCDMIDPYVNDTSNQIIEFCRGGKTFNSTQKSTIQERYAKMTQKPNAKSLSLDEYGKLMNTKRSELKCPIPSINVID